MSYFDGLTSHLNPLIFLNVLEAIGLDFPFLKIDQQTFLPMYIVRPWIVHKYVILLGFSTRSKTLKRALTHIF